MQIFYIIFFSGTFGTSSGHKSGHKNAKCPAFFQCFQGFTAFLGGTSYFFMFFIFFYFKKYIFISGTYVPNVPKQHKSYIL